MIVLCVEKNYLLLTEVFQGQFFFGSTDESFVSDFIDILLTNCCKRSMTFGGTTSNSSNSGNASVQTSFCSKMLKAFSLLIPQIKLVESHPVNG